VRCFHLVVLFSFALLMSGCGGCSCGGHGGGSVEIQKRQSAPYSVANSAAKAMLSDLGLTARTATAKRGGMSIQVQRGHDS
jgi:hypothetical protein